MISLMSHLTFIICCRHPSTFTDRNATAR